MSGRGRKVQPESEPIIPGERMPPPADLDPEQQEVWHDITGRFSPDYFGPDSAATLAELCRHVAYARQLGEMITEVRKELATDRKSWATFDSLLKAHARQSNLIARISQKLRLVPSARAPATARDDRKRSGGSAKPWKDWGSAPAKDELQ